MNEHILKFISASVLSSIAVGIYYYVNKNYYHDETDRNTMIRVFVMYFLVSIAAVYFFDIINTCPLSGCLKSAIQTGGGNSASSDSVDFLTKHNVEKFQVGQPPF